MFDSKLSDKAEYFTIKKLKCSLLSQTKVYIWAAKTFTINVTQMLHMSGILAKVQSFSSNRPTGPIRSSSRDVHVSIYQSVPF